jgi:RND family efflux transporter MFP subunit
MAPASASTVAAAGMLSVLSVEHEVDVLAKLSGVVVQAPKEESQQVRAGEELARLDDRQLVAQLDKAQADLTVAEDNVKYNEAELKAKQANLRRTQQLRQLGLGSEADLDNADFLEKGAEYDLKAWEATVVGNQANVRELQAELDQTRIRAPFSGVIAHRYIREGQSVLKDEKCFRISQLSPLQVQFQVPETSGRKPHLGDAVHLATVEDAGRTLQARVVKMSPIVDPASDSYDVTARLTGADISDLRPGMAVRVEWSGAAAVAAAPKK